MGTVPPPPPKYYCSYVPIRSEQNVEVKVEHVPSIWVRFVSLFKQKTVDFERNNKYDL